MIDDERRKLERLCRPIDHHKIRRERIRRTHAEATKATEAAEGWCVSLYRPYRGRQS